MLVVGGLAGAACGAGHPPVSNPAKGEEANPSAEPPETPDGSRNAPGDERAGWPAAIQSLPPAEALPTARAEFPAPVSLSIDQLGIDRAPVVPVGLEANGDMEVPGAAEVGWYRYGTAPGNGGSAVLAAHIAYDGVDGVFRDLSDLRVGAEALVTFEDGASVSFVIAEVARYPKTDLPDDIFAREGDSRLVLVTCGGAFDQENRRYRDNVVAYARPAGGD